MPMGTSALPNKKTLLECMFMSEKDYSTMVAMSKNLSVKLSNFVTSIQKQS